MKMCVSLVKAPECKLCKEKLVPASATQWQCGNERCEAYEVTVMKPGVYPFYVVQRERSGWSKE